MKKCLAALIFLSAVVCSCNKNRHDATCPVSYTVDSTVQLSWMDTTTHLRNWAFVGFEDTVTKKLDSPICGNEQAGITFTDSVLPVSLAPYYTHTFWYYGTALINYYSGSYDTLGGTNIALSPTRNTSVTGTDDAQAFENRFHDLLVNVSSYHINHNELTLYPVGSTVVLKFKANY